MKHDYDRHTVHSFQGKEHITYWVTFYTQPWRHWLWARVYHWYDMRVHRVPGYRLWAKWYDWRQRNKDWRTYLPLSAEQDCRCYYLTEKGRTVLFSVEVTKEQYQDLGGE